jgi:hypothetical protein
VGTILSAAFGIPLASRRRRVLTALAKFLPGTLGDYWRGERWFDVRIIRAVAAASAGASEAECAGYVAALMAAGTHMAGHDWEPRA